VVIDVGPMWPAPARRAPSKPASIGSVNSLTINGPTATTPQVERRLSFCRERSRSRAMARRHAHGELRQSQSRISEFQRRCGHG
jgi:hypothetical protein